MALGHGRFTSAQHAHDHFRDPDEGRIKMVGERQPLIRPTAANQVWSMNFVFDRTAKVPHAQVQEDHRQRHSMSQWALVERALSGPS